MRMTSSSSEMFLNLKENYYIFIIKNLMTDYIVFKIASFKSITIN